MKSNLVSTHMCSSILTLSHGTHPNLGVFIKLSDHIDKST